MLVGQGGDGEIHTQQAEEYRGGALALVKGEAGHEIEPQQTGDDGKELVHIVQLHRVPRPHLVGGNEPHAEGKGRDEQGHAVFAAPRTLKVVPHGGHDAHTRGHRHHRHDEPGIDGIAAGGKIIDHQAAGADEQEAGEHPHRGIQGVVFGGEGLVIALELGVFARQAQDKQHRRHHHRESNEGHGGGGPGDGQTGVRLKGGVQFPPAQAETRQAAHRRYGGQKILFSHCQHPFRMK